MHACVCLNVWPIALTAQSWYPLSSGPLNHVRLLTSDAVVTPSDGIFAVSFSLYIDVSYKPVP